GELAKKNSKTIPESAPEAGGGTNRIPPLLPPKELAQRNDPSSRPGEKAVPDPEAVRLSAELVQAAPAQREALLEKLNDSKGVLHTEAWAMAIPQLSGPSKTKARDALAERIARMTAATLVDKLRDDNLEIRRAAALACAMKEEKKLIPNLIQ